VVKAKMCKNVRKIRNQIAAGVQLAVAGRGKFWAQDAGFWDGEWGPG